MPYHEVKDPFQTAQDVLFEQLRKAGAEKQRQEREQQQSMNDYLREQVHNYNNGVDPADNETGYGTEKTNKEVQDSMNEKLADKGISVDNVNTNPVSNAEHVTMDRSQSKTDTVGTGTATTSGQPDKKLATQPKTSDSPLGDSNTMGKMKTSTSTNSTSLDTPSVEPSAPKSNVRTSNETATPKTVPNEPSATIVQKDAGSAKGAVGESFSGTKTTELPKNNVNADKAGLIGLKNSKSFKK